MGHDQREWSQCCLSVTTRDNTAWKNQHVKSTDFEVISETFTGRVNPRVGTGRIQIFVNHGGSCRVENSRNSIFVCRKIYPLMHRVSIKETFQLLLCSVSVNYEPISIKILVVGSRNKHLTELCIKSLKCPQILVVSTLRLYCCGYTVSRWFCCRVQTTSNWWRV